MKKILIAIDIFNTSKKINMKIFDQHKIEVNYNTTNKELIYHKNSNLYKDVDYIIAGLEEYDSNFFIRFPNVKAISRIGVGTDNIDLIAARKNGVKIFKTSDKPSVAVAELCISNIISLLRNTHTMSNNLKKGNWNQLVGREIRNMNVGIVGLGSIGKQIAKRLAAFEVNISGYGRSWDEKFAGKYNVEKKSLEDILINSDIISIHLPLDNETKGLINEDLIFSMKKDSILINTSRFAVIDNKALAKAIKSKKIYGAAIDVFNEDKNIHPYDQIENVILTPHIGSHTLETRKEMELAAVKNVINYHSLLSKNYSGEIDKLLIEIDRNTVK
tara:strand:+ start:27999 stop:28988 length:990 start_codon:yes stop_codon:yes gene_type:complete